MRIIDAFWEKRNLGVETKEIILDNNDLLQDLENILNPLSFERRYIVAKVPVGRPDFIKFLTDKGFCFIESLFEVTLRIEEFELPKAIKRFDDMLMYRKLATNDDFERLGREIKRGVFTTDRIALDPNFGIDIAAIRYVNWIMDEVQNGTEVYEILYKENPIGFFTLKNLSDGKYDNFLAGMYRGRQNNGLGFSMLSKPIIELKKRKAKFYVSHVSSNNLAIMRLDFSFGFSPTNVVYVMTKIQGEMGLC